MPADRTQDEEITRLIGLGAAVVSDRRPDFGWVILADPKGNEFDVEISLAERDADCPQPELLAQGAYSDVLYFPRRSSGSP